MKKTTRYTIQYTVILYTVTLLYSLTGFTQCFDKVIGVGGYCLGQKTDGTLWTWGGGGWR